MALLQRFLILLFSICFISVYSYEYIPVYMWETSKSYSPLPALGRINEEFFRDILLDKFNKDKIVLVFLEENLSPEDFSTFDSTGESVFYSLSHLRSKAQVNYYPFVEAPLKALQSLPGVKVSKIDVTAKGLPSDLKIEPGQVLIVDLNDAKENEDRSHMLRRHDSLVASIYKKVLSENENVIALYTARHTSWLVPSELDDNGIGRKARHLLETEDKPSDDKEDYIIINQDTTLMYTKIPIVFNLTTESGDISISIKKVNSKEVNDNTTVIKTDEVDITFEFESSLGYWYLRSVEIMNNTDKKSYDINVTGIFAPFGFSYHCNNTIYSAEREVEIEKDKTEKQKYLISLPSFQVQRFMNSSSGNFSYAYDCIGFTTAPIWSGLFVTFILAMIMTVGLCMIMDIKTMDRFDDPKGKTISINVVE